VHSLEEAKQAIRDVGEHGIYLDVTNGVHPDFFPVMMRDLLS